MFQNDQFEFCDVIRMDPDLKGQKKKNNNKLEREIEKRSIEEIKR